MLRRREGQPIPMERYRNIDCGRSKPTSFSYARKLKLVCANARICVRKLRRGADLLIVRPSASNWSQLAQLLTRSFDSRRRIAGLVAPG